MVLVLLQDEFQAEHKKMSAGQNQDFQKKTTYESDKI